MTTVDIYAFFKARFPELAKEVQSFKAYGIRGIELNLGGGNKLIFKLSSKHTDWRLETPDYFKTEERIRQ